MLPDVAEFTCNKVAFCVQFCAMSARENENKHGEMKPLFDEALFSDDPRTAKIMLLEHWKKVGSSAWLVLFLKNTSSKEMLRGYEALVAEHVELDAQLRLDAENDAIRSHLRFSLHQTKDVVYENLLHATSLENRPIVGEAFDRYHNAIVNRYTIEATPVDDVARVCEQLGGIPKTSA
jgi:hypothetical protein